MRNEPQYPTKGYAPHSGRERNRGLILLLLLSYYRLPVITEKKKKN